MAEIGYTSADPQFSWLDDQAAPRARRGYRAVYVGLALTIALAGVAVASELNRAPAATSRVASGSMEPTLTVGQVVHLDASAYSSGAPHIGDIVAFHAPAGAVGRTSVCGVANATNEACPQSTPAESGQIFIKRVVAAPGDTFAVVNGSVVRNGATQSEPFAIVCSSDAACNLPTAIRIPAGEWFLMGDDRQHSDDSRFWGPVPQAWITGRIVP